LTLFTKLPARCSMSARRCSRSSLHNHSSAAASHQHVSTHAHAALSAFILPLLSWGAELVSLLRWRSQETNHMGWAARQHTQLDSGLQQATSPAVFKDL
jgi:hypothetical protein